MNKNILVLSLSKITSSSSRVLKEGQTLLKNGFSVTVASICYDNQTEKEDVQGVPVRRFLLRSKKLPKYFIFQIIKWMEWYSLLKKWITNDGRGIAIIDCHCLYTLLIGFFLAKQSHSKIVFNAHELETERNGLSGFRKQISQFLEKKLIKKCSATIVVSQSILEWYQQAYPNIKVNCIYNAPMLQEPIKNDYFKKIYKLSTNDVIFLYQGAFFSGRGIPLLLETFKQLPPNYHIVFMGFGPEEQAIKNASQKCLNIHIHDVVPQKDLYKYTPSANYGFSLIESVSLSYELCMPNKLFEYTMYEVPVIVSNTKDQSTFIRKNRIGYVLEDYTPNGLKQLILSVDISEREVLVQNMKKIKTDICWENQEEKLVGIYNSILV